MMARIFSISFAAGPSTACPGLRIATFPGDVADTGYAPGGACYPKQKARFHISDRGGCSQSTVAYTDWEHWANTLSVFSSSGT